jgi:hypothetical protein
MVHAKIFVKLYGAWTLDVIIDLAHAVALDFVARPQSYGGLDADRDRDVIDIIQKFRVSYGKAERFEDAPGRQAMVLPILARSDALRPDSNVGTSSFYLARKRFLDACTAFSERTVESGVHMLAARVVSSLVTLRAYFDGLNGASAGSTSKRIVEEFENATRVLKSPGVATMFGQKPPADADWPLEADPNQSDPNGAKLVEAIGASLAVPPEDKLSYLKFILLQRVAQVGSAALTLALEDNALADVADKAKLDLLVTAGYLWATALRDYQGL